MLWLVAFVFLQKSFFFSKERWKREGIQVLRAANVSDLRAWRTTVGVTTEEELARTRASALVRRIFFATRILFYKKGRHFLFRMQKHKSRHKKCPTPDESRSGWESGKSLQPRDSLCHHQNTDVQSIPPAIKRRTFSNNRKRNTFGIQQVLDGIGQTSADPFRNVVLFFEVEI